MSKKNRRDLDESSRTASDPKNPPPLSTEHPRRGFFVSFLTGALGAVLGLFPVVLGSLFFFDPLIRKRSARQNKNGGENERKDADGFINLRVSIDSLPADGTPVSAKVHDDKVDAWNQFSQVDIGTVWLRRTENGEVVAFSSICPHLGCAVDYRAAQRDFFCPCHTSAFALDGVRTNFIPPRDMDRLETRIKPETGNMIWLKYEVFRGGIQEQETIG